MDEDEKSGESRAVAVDLFGETDDLKPPDEDDVAVPTLAISAQNEHHESNTRDKKAKGTAHSSRVKKIRSSTRAHTKRKSAESDDEGGDEPLGPIEAKKLEAERDVEEVLARIKSRTRRKNTYADDAFSEELTYRMTVKMREAAEEDIRLSQEQKPAIEKLKLLPSVKRHLIRIDFSDLDSAPEVLSCIKLWLEPLPNGSLPSLDVQLTLMEILRRLPITVEDLRESLVGRIVKFYEVSERPILEVRKLAAKLIDKWSLLVVNKGEADKDPSGKLAHNYRQRHYMAQQFMKKDITRPRGCTGDNKYPGNEIYCRLQRKMKIMNASKKSRR